MLTGEEIAALIRALTENGLDALRRVSWAQGGLPHWQMDGRHMRSPERLGLVAYKQRATGGVWELTARGRQVVEVIK